MSTAINQKAYLQKYLTGKSADKKKKKKKAVKGKGFQIIDDDLDLSKLRPLDIDELDILNEGEDAPQIAGIIDERPEEIRKLEDFKTSSKWRVINQDDGFNSKLKVEEVKRNDKEVEKENEIVFGKMYSDSEDDNKNDSDPSPPRKNSEKNLTKKNSKRNQSDSDFSPPRRKDKSKDKNYDSNPSPPRNTKKQVQNNVKSNRNDSDASTPRRENSSKWMTKSYDSDASPPRKRDKTSQTNKNYDTKLSPPRQQENSKLKRVRKPTRWGDFDTQEDKSRRSRSHEISPNKSYNKSHSSEKNNRQKHRSKDYDSDLSPPRKSKRHSPKANPQDSDASPPRRKSPEKRKIDKYDKYRNIDRNNTDKRKDLSPKNKRSEQFKRKERRTEKRYESDSDLSPPRKDRSKNYNRRDYRNDDDDEPPPTNKKMEKTLEGKKAGLQDAEQLKEENQAFRRREDDAFKNMTDEMSGRNAKAVSRKSKRETSEDRQKQREKAERQKVLDEKYKKWSKGIKQIEAQQAAVQDFIHEASKPLARYKDDRDLEDKLRDVERAGDPMLQYMREKKRERGELGPEKPTYKGNFPPNRFNIRPGYRWDGVDRSNGYEKKFFDQQSKRKAQEEEVYKWSTEDL